jgi:curli biogenesis system outer membrane secretion channel CsgG
MSKLINRRVVMTLAAAAAVIPIEAVHAKDDAQRILNQAVPPVPGPRRTIAVGNIDVIGPVANASATNVGGPIAGMLTTALSESDRFLVVERDAVAQMITEMDMAKSGVSAGSSAPQPGHMLPAQYLVVGSITEYTNPAAGSGGGVTIGGGTSLTLGGSKGGIGIDLRIVDTRTGAVVKAFKVHRKLTAMNVGLATGYKGVPIATNGFFNTPLGDATRRALNDAVIEIAAALAGVPWRGQVVKAENGVVWVNAGAEGGIAVGDRLTLQRIGETFTDPATGQVLSQHLVDLGQVTITNVEPKLAWGGYAGGAGDPQRGDYVMFGK